MDTKHTTIGRIVRTAYETPRPSRSSRQPYHLGYGFDIAVVGFLLATIVANVSF